MYDCSWLGRMVETRGGIKGLLSDLRVVRLSRMLTLCRLFIGRVLWVYEREDGLDTNGLAEFVIVSIDTARWER